MATYETLINAVIANQADEVQQLLLAGANPNYCADSQEGFTLVHLAALYNADLVMPILIQAGADTQRTTNQDGITALEIAMQHHHTNIIEQLKSANSTSMMKN